MSEVKPFRPNPELVWGRAVDFRATPYMSSPHCVARPVALVRLV